MAVLQNNQIMSDVEKPFLRCYASHGNTIRSGNDNFVVWARQTESETGNENGNTNTMGDSNHCE